MRNENTGFYTGLGYALVNVVDFGADATGVTTSTTAIRAALTAAIQSALSISSSYGGNWTIPSIFFPPGHYVIDDTINFDTTTATRGLSYVSIFGDGHPLIRQTDSTKDTFVWATTSGQSGQYLNVIRGLQFYGGRRHISAQNANNESAKLIIEDCDFRNSADYAIYYPNSANSLLVVRDNRFFFNAMLLYNSAHACDVIDCIMDGPGSVTSNVAMFYNDVSANLRMRNFNGSPSIDSANSCRWIDNYGPSVAIDASRFGGEGASNGIGVVWQNAAPHATNGFTNPTMISITNSQIAAGHTAANSGVINIRTHVPQNIIMKGNSYYGHAPKIANVAGFNYATYFAGFPPTYRRKCEAETDEKWFDDNTDLAGVSPSIPLALRPYLTGTIATSAKGFHSGGIPARVSTDGTDSTPVATEVYIAEVNLTASCLVTGISNFNGSVASGNLKVGLANAQGIVVATSASTAMVGADVYQRIAFTGTYLVPGPGTYYILVFVDNNTARINTHTFGDFAAGKQTAQVYATGFTTITPPTTFTAGLGPMASLY